MHKLIELNVGLQLNSQEYKKQQYFRPTINKEIR